MINLISVLTIWCHPFVELSLVLLEEDVCYDQYVLLANSVSLCPTSFCIPKPKYVWKSVSCSVMSDSFTPHELYSTRLLYSGHPPGKNIAVGSHSLFQGIFLTQGSNPGLLHCRQIIYHLSHQGSGIDHLLMSMCSLIFGVVWTVCLLWPVCFPDKTVSLCPAAFCTPMPNLPLTADIPSYFYIPIPYDEKDNFFWC